MKKDFDFRVGKRQNEKGITLIVIVIIVVILIILAVIGINVAFRENGFMKRGQDEKNMTEEVTKNDTLEGQEESETTGILADGSYNAEKGVNTPKLGENMNLVKFDVTIQDWVVDKTNSSYNYIDTSIGGNANKSEWANAKVTTQVNGENIESYFVWIPRYAYKITYYTDESKIKTSETPTEYGTIDVKFIEGTGKTATDGTQCKYASEIPTSNDYIIHPAFTDEVDNGGWNSQIEGIWIGKYEAARSDTQGVTQGTATTLKVQPGVTSFRNITIGDMYTYAKAYDTNLKSHMLKNSEWGAVAYLTESKYGRNGAEVGFSGEGYITGGGEGKDYVENNQNQSSTGNVYGIYDLRGGAYEYVACYYRDGNIMDLNYGLSFTSTKISDEYSTVYAGIGEASTYKYGDATYETRSWHSDNADFMYSNLPLLLRGGNYYNGDFAGVFSYYNSDGSNGVYYSFRLALVL